MYRPKGLYLISATEMWESFSFYIFTAILVLFMMDVLHFSDEFSTFLYGIIIGAAYFIQIVSGLICDRYLGNRKSIIIGSIFMVISQLIFTYDASLYYLTEDLPVHSNFLLTYPEIMFIIGIVLMVVGVSLFKVSNTSLISLLYEDHPEDMDSAYSIFYFALCFGGFLATLTLTFILDGSNSSLYQYGFLMGFLSILIGLIMFFAFKDKYLALENGKSIGIVPTYKNSKNVSEKTNEGLSKIEIRHIGVILLILMFVFVFFMGHEQIFTSIILFALDYVNNALPVLNMEIPLTFYLSINALFVIIIGIVLIKLYDILAARNKEPSSISKIIVGLFSLSFAYSILLLSLNAFDRNMQINMAWIILFNLFIVISEFLILPPTLSLISKISPKKYITLMFGIYYAVLGIGEIGAGSFASAFPNDGPKMLFGLIPIPHFHSFFSVFVILGFVLAIVLLLLKSRLEKIVNKTD